MAPPKKIATLATPLEPFENIPKTEQRIKHWQPASPPSAVDVCDGLTAVADYEIKKAIEPDGSKNLWSLSSALVEDNRLLKAAASGVRLSHSTASKLVGHWPHWPDEEPPYPKLALVADMPITLLPVVPSGALPSSLGLKTTLLLPSDCSKAACMIMGATDTAHTQMVLRTGAVIPVRDGNSADAFGYLLVYLMSSEATTPEKVAAALETKKQSELRDIYKAAYLKYMNLPSPARAEMAKKYGINEYAMPKVGEAFVSRSLNDITFLDKPPASVSAYPHHWGAVIMHRGSTSGDGKRSNVQITLEILRDHPGTSWYFHMYGNKGLKEGAQLRGDGLKTFHRVWMHRQFEPHCMTAVFQVKP